MSSPVSIVIPTWNGRHLLDQFLPSIFEAGLQYRSVTGADVEVVIVDDGSTDGTAEWITDITEASSIPIRLIVNAANAGFGAACNRGVREAASPLVFLVNNDVRADKDVLAPLALAFQGDPSLLAVHCRVMDLASGREVGTGKVAGFGRGFLRVHRSYVTRGPRRGPLYSIFASGGSSMFSRDRFLELGGFDPLFAPFYFEDVELCYRGWKRGLTVRYEPDAVVSHQFSSTIGTHAARRVPIVSQRNRLILHWIHLHDARWLASHVLCEVVIALTAPLRFKPNLTRAFLDALRLHPQIRARRREERQRATRTDRDVLKVFSELIARADVRAYDDPRELTSTT